MKQTITLNIFRDEMQKIRPDNFSYEGLGELFDYLEEMGEDLEFDPIAICCDFSECSLDEFLQSYGVDADLDEFSTMEDKAEAITEYIGRNGFWYALVNDNEEIIFENF